VNEIAALLSESLRAWRIAGAVREEDGATIIECGETRLRVTPAPPDHFFRWIVLTGTRERGFTGIPGLLRGVRGLLDPDYAASRLQIAARPVLEP
jgi:hypothetical protein